MPRATSSAMPVQLLTAPLHQIRAGPICKSTIQLLAGNPRLEFQLEMTGSEIERKNPLHRRDAVENAVYFNEAGLHDAAVFLLVIAPGNLKLFDVGFVD